MIDVKLTILETIKDKIKKLRFLANNDVKGFKKILSLIILNDLCEWSNYLDVQQSIQKKLQDIRNKYILCQRDFIIKYGDRSTAYVNVNTPQTNYTWKRLWDAQDLKLINDITTTKNNTSSTVVIKKKLAPINIPNSEFTESEYLVLDRSFVENEYIQINQPNINNNYIML